MIKAERELIEGIRRAANRSRNRAVIQGIGDDCAVLRIAQGHELLITTDLCIENVHFRREWHPARSVGHRCLARGLSDIAAMGGEALACFLSLGLPARLPQRWADDFLKGLIDLARRFGVQLAGGDTAAAPQITADIIVTGQVPAGRALLRSGSRPGDRIFVTGQLGRSGAVLKQLFSGKKVRPSAADPHFYPAPRLEIGRLLRERRLATAMIDISDGLSVDLAHICDESGVCAGIHSSRIPTAKGADLNFALHGGDDYELLFTAPRKARIPSRLRGVPITEIGMVYPRKHYRSAIILLDENGSERPLQPLGWQHFESQQR